MKSSTLANFLIREKTIQAIRQFLTTAEFVEITPPILNRGLPLEPNLYPFVTTWQTLAGEQALYLPASPEAAIKKMLALGIPQCFAIGHCFRNFEPADIEHQPEFLMLEWYRAQAQMDDIMNDVQELILAVKKNLNPALNLPTDDHFLTIGDQKIDLTAGWQQFSLIELFKKYCQIELEDVWELPALQAVAQARGYQTQNSTWEELYNQLFTNEIEPRLPKTPCFVVDFPAQISPLCTRQTDHPQLAQRFEFYLAGLELANGNQEQTDAQLVADRFHQEEIYRQHQHLPQAPIDEDFLSALGQMSALGQFAGIGLGVERLAMLLAGVSKLKAINPFSLSSQF